MQRLEYYARPDANIMVKSLIYIIGLLLKLSLFMMKLLPANLAMSLMSRSYFMPLGVCLVLAIIIGSMFVTWMLMVAWSSFAKLVTTIMYCLAFVKLIKTFI